MNDQINEVHQEILNDFMKIHRKPAERIIKETVAQFEDADLASEASQQMIAEAVMKELNANGYIVTTKELMRAIKDQLSEAIEIIRQMNSHNKITLEKVKSSFDTNEIREDAG